MRRALRVGDLIRRNDRDIAMFQELIDKLEGKPGTSGYVADLKMRIAVAKRTNAILRTKLLALTGARSFANN
jgi:hypothetical protein